MPRVQEGMIVEPRPVSQLVPGDVVQHYSTWEQTYGDAVRRRVVKIEFGPDMREHEHVVTYVDVYDRDADPYDVREKSGRVVDVVVGHAPQDRALIIDILCAAQGDAYRGWYEKDRYGREAVDRAMAAAADAPVPAAALTGNEQSS